jgi:hypothetical protein
MWTSNVVSVFHYIPMIPWLTGVSIVLALFGLLISHRNFRLSARRARAEKEAAQKVSNLSLVLYTARISGDGNYEPPRHFLLSCPRKPGRFIDIPFVVELENLGSKTASGGSLYLRFPLELGSGTPSQYDGRRPANVSVDKDWEIVQFDVGEVHPGQNCIFTDHLVISDALFQRTGQVAVFLVGFRLEQQDTPATEGNISFGVLDLLSDRPGEHLHSLSELLPVGKPYESWTIRNRLLQVMYRMSQGLRYKGAPMVVGKSVFVLAYDNALITPTESADRVPRDALLSMNAVQDNQGELWVTGINAKHVLMFHGKLRPEIPGRNTHKVKNLGVKQLWPYDQDSLGKRSIPKD